MKRSATLFTAGFLIISLSGCAELQLSRMLQSVSKTARDRYVSNLGCRAEQQLQAGNPQEVFRLLEENPRHQIPLNRFHRRAVDLLIKQAESAELNEQYLEAGRHYHLAMQQYRRGGSSNQIEPELQNRLNHCAGKLLQSGLHSYRTGELEKAIDIWSQIRAFNPDYKASELAIETTRIQIRELEKLPPGS